VTTDIFLPTVTWVGVVGLSIGVRSHAGVACSLGFLRFAIGGHRAPNIPPVQRSILAIFGERSWPNTTSWGHSFYSVW